MFVTPGFFRSFFFLSFLCFIFISFFAVISRGHGCSREGSSESVQLYVNEPRVPTTPRSAPLAMLLEESPAPSQACGSPAPHRESAADAAPAEHSTPPRKEDESPVKMRRVSAQAVREVVAKITATANPNRRSSDLSTQEVVVHGDHQLRMKTFTLATTCQVCDKLLEGLALQGLKCSCCKCCVHTHCVAALKPECQLVTRIQRQKSGLPVWPPTRAMASC
jgi:hypothetical protein